MIALPFRMRRPCLIVLGTLLLSAAAAAQEDAPAPPAPEAIDNATCLACHGDPSAERFVDPARFEASIHGAHQCASCHTDITAVPHDVPAAPVSCAACHQIEADVYLKSDHGLALTRGVSEAASCRDCHGSPHELRNSRDPASPVFHANIPDTCGRCHGKTEEMAKFHLSQRLPVASYEQSVHGLALLKAGNAAAAACTDCHGSHDLHKATNPASKLHWQRIAATCGKCHENIQDTYLRSVHGKAMQAGKRDAPVCTDCHGEHSIEAVKTVSAKVFPSQIPETCGQCHAAERITTKYQLSPHVVETYMDSFHGLALQGGSVTAANCASCHGTHDILPAGDPQSSINPGNLAKTCSQCHAGVSAQVAKGQIHSGTRPGLEHVAVSVVRRFYLVLIVLVIGGMALHNLLDFLKKFRAHYARMAAARVRPRMSLSVRVQHVVLIVAFLLLAYTGFALTSPQAWWASPFLGRVDWRSFGHRAAAVVFCGLALYHLGYVLLTSRGRHHVRALLPRRIDLVQPWQMLAYYLGWRRERPVFARYSYIEKAEYWALVWGSVIMAVTGGMMTWEDWTLRVFPKWFFDVVTAVHYYEAVLACLAILVWHFYFVIFDPDEYPMKWTWVTGLPSGADQTHRRADPHEPPPPEESGTGA
ncbi:MAG: cytochrome b/b6 domain-containing protein [Candidatus Omnitrophica bacterium]|nr:cytochrome b/b6 domain-containing protein [Candidatus Omnitrophota bacterium]